MPLKLFKRKTRDGRHIWHYRGTIAGDRLRGTTGTTDRKIAARLVSEIENRHHKRHLDGPQEVLTFPQAVAIYEKAGKGLDARSARYIAKLEDYWKNAKVKDMTSGAIKQSAIDLCPGCSGATWNREVITPTQAIINHCAELELCSPIRIKRFEFETAIKTPVTLEWLNTLCAHARPIIKALVLTMFATACRFGEAHRLDWPDLNFKERTIKIRDTKTKKQRIAHMPQPLLVALANLPRDKAPFHRSESSSRRHWDADVATVAEAVDGFERLTFHSCRHGFATKMLHDGIDPKTAASLGGWDDIGLFMETYAHAMQDRTLTDKLFDTPLTREGGQLEKKQDVSRK
jgi:integrase